MDGLFFILKPVAHWGMHWFQMAIDWAFRERSCDVSAWAIAFTMNTWAVSLARVLAHLRGAVRKAIDESRARAQQAQFLERVRGLAGSHSRDARKVLERFSRFLTHLERLCVKYPKAESYRSDEPIKGSPRIILGIASVFSLLCILFSWFYNWTLIVLLPYPCFVVYYHYKKWSLPRFIRKRFDRIEKSVNAIPDVPPPPPPITAEALEKRLEVLGKEDTAADGE